MRRCVLISNTPTLAVVGGTYLPESGQLTSKVVVLHRPEWLDPSISGASSDSSTPIENGVSGLVRPTGTKSR